MKYDLIVIGAGPAGSSAAITAAQAGAKVLLLEKGRFPRHKVCGEFVSAESLGLLSNLLAAEYRPLLREALRIPKSRVFLDGRILQAEIDPAAASIARFDLDFALWQSAKQSGIEAREQVTVQSISSQSTFHVKSSAGEFESRALINASGRWSNLTALSADKRSAEKWIGLKGHFSETNPPNSVDLYFFDGGYCGVERVNLTDDRSQGRVNACAMVRADIASNLSEVFPLNSALQARSGNWQPFIDPVTTSPLIFRTPTPVRDSVFQVGDAAAFVDPFIGDGISLALRSGALAAQTLLPFLSEEISLEQATENYRQIYERDLARVFRASSKLRRMLAIPRTVRKPFVFMLEKNPRITNYLVRKTR